MRACSRSVCCARSVIGLTAFLTVVDLFATQAILPLTDAALRCDARGRWASRSMPARWAWPSPASPVCAVQPADRPAARHPAVSLAVLAVPTALLAVAPRPPIVHALRVAQGLCMASAFTLTLAYLGERLQRRDAGGAFAAYITGNVASNLVGRLISAAVADHWASHSNFYFFAALNLAGAVLVYFTRGRRRWSEPPPSASRSAAWHGICASASACGFRHRILHPVRVHRDLHLRQFRACEPAARRCPRWRSASPISFRAVDRDDTAGGPAVARYRYRADDLDVLRRRGRRTAAADRAEPRGGPVGMVLVGVGTFFAQAVATGFVSSAATPIAARQADSISRPISSAEWSEPRILGQVFDRFGW